MTRPSIHLPTEAWVAIYPKLAEQVGYSVINPGTPITVQVTEGDGARYYIGVSPPTSIEDSKPFIGRVDLPSPTDEVWVRADPNTTHIVVEELSSQAPTIQTIPSQTVKPIMASDLAGRSARNTATQEALVAVRQDKFNLQFQYNVPYQDYENTEVRGNTTGGGSISHAGASAVIGNDGTTGSAYITSRESIRYLPGHEFYTEMTIRAVSPPDTDSRVLWGVGNPGRVGDGMFYTLEPTLAIVYRNNGVETLVPRDQWTHDRLDGTGPSGLDIAIDKISLWTLSGGWYGILPLVWGVFAKDYGYVTTHIYDPSNSLEDPHLGNPNLPALVECDRVVGTGDPFLVEVSSIRGGVSGPIPELPVADRGVPLKTPAPVAVSANTDTPLISIRNPTTFQGKPNTIRTRIDYISVTVSGVKPTSIAIHRLGSVTGGTWVTPTPNTSPIEVNYTATAFTPDVNPSTSEQLIEVFGFDLNKEDSSSESLKSLEIPVAVYPGEVLTVIANSSGATEVTARVQAVSEF